MSERLGPDTAEPDPGQDPDFVTLAGRLVRAVRYHRCLSQRELADLARVRRETVGRIEADRVVPRFDTLLTVLAGGGFSLGLIDHRGRPLELHPERDVLRDRARRHLPPHLRPVPTPRYMGPIQDGTWWGWHRIAWPADLERVPEYTYWRRPQCEVVSLLPGWSHRIWDDAT